MDTFIAITPAGNPLRFGYAEDKAAYTATGTLTDLEGDTIDEFYGCDCDGTPDGHGACSIPQCLMEQDSTHRYWAGRHAA